MLTIHIRANLFIYMYLFKKQIIKRFNGKNNMFIKFP